MYVLPYVSMSVGLLSVRLDNDGWRDGWMDGWMSKCKAEAPEPHNPKTHIQSESETTKPPSTKL